MKINEKLKIFVEKCKYEKVYIVLDLEEKGMIYLVCRTIPDSLVKTKINDYVLLKLFMEGDVGFGINQNSADKNNFMEQFKEKSEVVFSRGYRSQYIKSMIHILLEDRINVYNMGDNKNLDSKSILKKWDSYNFE